MNNNSKKNNSNKPKTLNEVRKFLNTIPLINSGGCGIAALAMYRWMKKNNPGIKVRIVFCYNELNHYKTNSLTKINNKAWSCSHAGIKLTNDPWYRFQRTFIDCNETIKYNQYKYHHFLDEDVVLLAINTRAWNEVFDRHYVKKIAKHLDIDLSDVTDFNLD